MRTDPEEFNRFIKLLPPHINPHLIPVSYHKSPDIPRGENATNGRYKLSVEEARKRLEYGKNVAMYLRDDFAVLDVDDPMKFTVAKLSCRFHMVADNGDKVCVWHEASPGLCNGDLCPLLEKFGRLKR